MRNFKVHAIRHGESVPGIGTTFGKKDCLIPVQVAAGSTKFKLLFADKEGKVVELNVPAIESVQTSLAGKTDKGGYNGTAKDLKDAIDNINSILNSDDSTLDEMQEIVNFIKLNRSTLNALSINSIAGLQTELNKKVDKVAGKQLSTEDFTTELKNKLVGLQNVDISGKADKDASNINVSVWQTKLEMEATASGNGF